MKSVVILLSLFALAGCNPGEADMNENDLPKVWRVGESVPHDRLYSEPPEFPGSSHLNFFGLRRGDEAHRLYTIPAETPIAEIVRIFEVGSHGALSYGDDAVQTISMVADKASRIAEIVPCRITFADAAGLKKIEALFPENEVMQAGLERYVSQWDGESPLLAPVLKENLFHF